MSRSISAVLLVSLTCALFSAPAMAQRGASHPAPHVYSSARSASFHGGYGAYGGYGFGGYPFYPAYSSPLWVPPNYWWVSPYPSEDPRQAGYNPNAGYEWDSVGTLILETNPPQARVTLNGIYAGTTDKLGPFQLPVGQHTLHIEAPGFEPSDVIVKFDQPGVQTLNIELKRLTASAKPGPQR
jgi:hypothetical protein